MATASAYDRIGVGYHGTRCTDPELARAIWTALGDVRTVLNVGAGSGSYEPQDGRWVLAVEPSQVMIAQRPASAAPVIQASVESLPLADQSVDAAMAILTVQHWSDLEAGVRELVRVVRDRIVIVTMDVGVIAQLWIVRDYLPELLGQHASFPSINRLRQLLPNLRSEVLPVPRDCEDGFMAAFWARPEAYLDPAVRAATSPWHDLPTAIIDRAMTRLRADLDSGEWSRRYSSILAKDELDVGLRLITATS
ncbi:MAG: class I SAM-dependent methyltransferase [Solirubrobacteraceae bacterium]